MDDARPMKLRNKASTPPSVLVFFMVLFLSACSHKTLSVFFDVPPPKPQPELTEEDKLAEQKIAAPDRSGPGSFPDFTDSRQEHLPIEDMKNWEDVLSALPKDYKNKADWSAAIEQGIIRPRSSADNDNARYTTAFKYDFIMAAEKPKNEAYFPHSAHTQWLDCKNCHMTIYPYKRNPATMKEMRKGASCGTCHGGVAFSLKQCKRCHLKR